MLDSVQGRAPGMAFAPFCSLPELEACMNVWQLMEMIHSRSYTYIMKNIYSDPSAVFDTILRDERILERAASVTSAYDKFIVQAQEWGSGCMWQDTAAASPTTQWCRKDLKRLLYRAVANVNILKEYAFMSLLLVVLLSVNSSLWKVQQRSSPSLHEMKTNTWQLHRIY